MKSKVLNLFEKAVKEHKKQNRSDAKKIYKEILNIEPEHLIANHNLGAILVDEHQSTHALQFFQAALDGNIKSEQFWLSYIDALVNVGEVQKVQQAIKTVKSLGFSGEKFKKLQKRTLSPSQSYAAGDLFRAQDGHYLNFLAALHKNTYESYFEIGTRTGASLALSNSPSVAIDPYFQLNVNTVGNKDYCFMFQETSDSFFANSLSKISDLKCQLAFIDGMHLFEYALRDFINLAKISSEKSLFLFHDAIPWTFEMTTRNYESLGRNAVWTGDIWKLAHIFIDAGMKDDIRLLSTAPSGLLAVLNPNKKLVSVLENEYDEICAKWVDVNLNEDNIREFYATGIFEKPEIYLQSLRKISFGSQTEQVTRTWVSQ